jgi:hypothetical protein
MSITWRLYRPMPTELFEEMKVAAAQLGRSRDGVSHWNRRGAARRAENANFATAVNALDQAVSEEP